MERRDRWRHGVHGKVIGTRMPDDVVNRLISTGVLHTGFEWKADTDVSDRDIAEKNLILVDTPKQERGSSQAEKRDGWLEPVSEPS